MVMPTQIENKVTKPRIYTFTVSGSFTLAKVSVIMPVTVTVIEIYFRSKMSKATDNTYLPWPPWAA